MTPPSGGLSSRRLVISIALLWLAGNGLRLTVLAVPPVIPLIHDDLHLSETEVGILIGLPSFLFGLAAVPGSPLIARLGAKAALIAGLAVTAAGSALRGAVTDLAWLYLMTVVMGVGVAVMQVTMPSVVRAWLPHRIGFATAVYTNGLLVGETLPVALMLALVLPLVGGHWSWGFVVWSVPVALTALAVLALAPRTAEAASAEPLAGRLWWPDWRNVLIWRLGLMLGTVNALYFATNAFLPDYLTATGHPELISAGLSAINIGQLPASFLLLAIAGRLERAAWPYAVCGLLSFAGVAGIAFGSGLWIVASAAVLGFAAAAVLILVLALPPLLSPPEDVHRLTAAMFTVSYSCAMVVPVVSGLIWDLSGVPALTFVPIALCGLLLAALAPGINHLRAGPMTAPVRSR
jgi:CP family cyanate transporter-like MFS transporter